MKKFILLLIPIILTITLMACDFTSEDELSKSTDDSVFPESDVINTSDESRDITDTLSESNETVVEKTINDIDVKINGLEQLNNSGYDVDGEFSKKVSVTVKGTSSDLDSISAADIVAAIDVAGVVETGKIEVIIDYTAPIGIEIISTSDSLASISICNRTGSDSSDSYVSIPPVENTDAYIADNGIVISGTRGMEQFGGGASAGEQTAEKLNEFKKAVGENINVYILPAPISSAFYAPENYPNSIQNHINCFEGLRDALVNVAYVDTLAALRPHIDEDIYFRTDHHWQALGAYYAAEQLANVANTSFDNLSTFSTQSEEGIVGSYYGYSNDEILNNNPDTMVWYVPTREHTVTYYSKDYCDNPKTEMTLFSSNSGYTKFIHGDSYTTHIQSDVGNGRKLLLFKDSFGNALAPFLIGSFEEVYVADFRYFELNAKDFIAEKGITDVCFSMAAFSVAGSKRDNITRLINN